MLTVYSSEFLFITYLG